MGFFSRFSKKVEAVNKGEASPESISEELYIDEVELSQEEAMDIWTDMAQNIIINAVKATNQSVERAFILIDFDKATPLFDIFYQEQRRIVSWNELEDKESQEKIKDQLLPQAREIVEYLTDTFIQAELQTIRYAELQFEAATGAWFSHIIWNGSDESKLSKDKILNEWVAVICKTTPSKSLASDSKLPWYP